MAACAIFFGCFVFLPGSQAQQQLYWVGGNGHWHDPANWAATPHGPGGVGIPGAADEAVIEPGTPGASVQLDGDAWAKALTVDGTGGTVKVSGEEAALHVEGDLVLRGAVAWSFIGDLVLTGTGTIDLRGIPIRGKVTLEGHAHTLLSDLVVEGRHDLVLQSGTLNTNGAMLKAPGLQIEGQEARLVANGSVILLDRPMDAPPRAEQLQGLHSRLVVQGGSMALGTPLATAADRAANTCGTGLGQVPFTIDAVLVSNHNGYGVSCHGVCDGEVQATASGGVGPFTYSWVGGPSGDTWSNACRGNQIVIVTDQGQGISCATNVQVTDPTLLSVIFTDVQPPGCAGVCNGSVSGFAVGGVPPYSYTWNGGAASGPSLDHLCPGENTLLVADANGCVFDTTFSFPAQPIEPNLTVEHVDCAGNCNGTASVAPTGGSGSFDVTWGPGPLDGDQTNTVTGLCEGAYFVTISDANGCDTTLQFQITEPEPIIPNLVREDASCWGTCDGSASVNPTGGSGDYAYLWSPEPGSGQGTPQVDGLCQGTWVVIITDVDTGCEVEVTVEIEAPPAIIPNPQSTDPTCYGSCDGTATVAPTGGTTPYSYTWDPAPPTGQHEATASGLCAGTWSVTIRDWAFCDTTVQFNIQEPPPFEVTSTTADVSCAGECDGSVGVEATGGTGNLVYSWQPAGLDGDGTPNVDNLCAGQYSLTISDQNSCDTTVVFVIEEPEPITLTVNKTGITCGNVCTGAAQVQVEGGTPGYSFHWHPEPAIGQGTDSVEELCVGTYVVTVTDAQGCQATELIQIEPAPDMEVELTTQPVSCPGECDGQAAAIVSGGVPPYDHAWSPEPASGQGTPNASGFCPGPGSLVITDAAGCDTTINFTIDEPDPIQANAGVTQPGCAGDCDGSIVLNPSGGSGIYTYQWMPVPPNGNGHAEATGLCPGTYEVTITSGGCSITLSFTLEDTPGFDVQLEVTPNSCFGVCDGTATIVGNLDGLTFAWSHDPFATGNSVDSLCQGGYAVTISNAAGCDTTFAVNIDPPLPLEVEAQVEDATCGGGCDGQAVIVVSGGTPGYTFIWTSDQGDEPGPDTRNDLCPGQYVVTVTDSSGCEAQVAFAMEQATGFDLDVTVQNVTCAGECDGSILLEPQGGVEPYGFIWDHPGLAGAEATGLCAGSYQVQVVDAAGCDTTLVITIDEPDPIELQGTIGTIACGTDSTGSIELDPQGGTAPYGYSWQPTPPVGNGTAHAQGLYAGDWTVVVTDASGCSISETFNVPEPENLVVTVEVTGSHCAVCDGTAQLQVDGGTAPYVYQWSAPIDPDATDLVTDLCAGTYTVVVTDAEGCEAELTFSIQDPDGVDIEVIDGVTGCGGACDGTVAVLFDCAGLTCTVEWLDADGNLIGTEQTLDGLCEGTYTVIVTNDVGCATIGTAVVLPPEPIEADITSTPVSCAGLCDGSATVGIQGGNGPYQFVWSPEPGAGQGTPHATALCEGVYEVEVSDADGCQTTFQVLITAPEPWEIDVTSTDVACQGDCNGAIALTVQGGSGTPTYAWSPAGIDGDGTGQVSNLCAGTYSVTVGGDTGCDTTLTFIINEPAALSLIASSTPSHCSLCDGTVTANASGGSGALSVEWTSDLGPVGTGTTLTGLCAGSYTATLTDGNGCSTSQTLLVEDEDGEQIEAIDGQTLCNSLCEGEVSVVYTCATGPCEVAWYDADGTLLGTDDNLTGLCPGAYMVVVTNADGCTSTAIAQVVPQQQILPNLSTTPETCPGSCDGTATVGPTGGTPPYTYAWSDNVAIGPQATDLCPGTYEVLITDDNGCEESIQVLILAAEPLVVSAQVQEVTCAGAEDAAITLDLQGGEAPYTYEWDPVPPNGQGGEEATDLTPGEWSVLITDAQGCTLQQTFTITEPEPLEAAVSTSPSSCGMCNGEAAVVASGGTPPYTDMWTLNGGVMGTGAEITDLCAGLYQVNITDANGCTLQGAVPIEDLDGEELTTTGSALACAGDCDGTVSVAFDCGQPPCAVTWMDAAGNDLNEPGNQVDDLCQGMYLVQVINAAGCTAIDTAYVIAPEPISPNLSTTAASCHDSCDGAATVGPTGGSGGFTYQWYEGADMISSDPQVTDLCPGSYTVIITDDSGCSLTQDVLILAPDPLDATAVVGPITCNGACDGSITMTTAGGTPPYQYHWTPEPGDGQGSPTVTGLCVGAYQVTITDAAGCDTTFTMTLTEPPVLEVTTSHTDNICYGACEATASVLVEGGEPPYAIGWEDPDGTEFGQDELQVDALCSGTYQVSVIDARGCAITRSVVVGSAAPIEANLSVIGESCMGPCDGSATVEPSGGAIGNYTIVWGPGDPNGQATTAIDQLCAGDYFVTITDAIGCDTTYWFTIEPFQPIMADADLQQVSCNGDCDGSISLSTTGGAGSLAFQWGPGEPEGQGTNSISGLCPGDFTVTITDAMGCDTTYTFAISGPPALTVEEALVEDASCSSVADGSISLLVAGGTPPLEVEWSGPDGFLATGTTIEDLFSGTYAYTVLDAHDCALSGTLEVVALLPVIADAGEDQTQCFGFTVTLDGSQSLGAETYQWTNDQGEVIGEDPRLELEPLGVGTYEFVLTITNGPCSSSDTVQVVILQTPLADAGPNQVVYLHGSATLGGMPTAPAGSTIIWEPDSWLDQADVEHPVATVDTTTWFFLTVVDTNGCIGQDSVLVRVLPDVEVPSGFTPNGDGHNDTWVLDFAGLFPNLEVHVFNRWGEPLFHSRGYAEPWDGRYDGKVVPMGTYYYVIDLHDERHPEPLTGPLTVIR